MSTSRPILVVAGLVALVAVAASAAKLMYDRGAWQSPPQGLDVLVERTGMILHDVPQPMAEIAFTDAAGEPLSLADFEGRFVLLNLWATWCAPCIEEMPALDRLEAEVGGPTFTVVTLSQDRGGMNEVAPFWERAGLVNLAVHLDTGMVAGRTIGARGLPTTILIDPRGREIGRVEGPAEWDAPEVVAALKEVATPR